jgi:hypothetical protein
MAATSFAADHKIPRASQLLPKGCGHPKKFSKRILALKRTLILAANLAMARADLFLFGAIFSRCIL